MSVADDPALISRFQAGEESALETLIESHKVSLNRFIFRYVHDAAEVEDILYQTFVRAWQSRSRYRPTAKFQTWLFTIASNLCRDSARKKRRRPGDFAATSKDFDEELDSVKADISKDPTPAETAEISEEVSMLKIAIHELPHKLKNALILFSIEGYSQIEAGEMLGCSPKAVENRVRRAREILHKKLGALGVE